MAANFWTSSHCKEWLFTKEKVFQTHKRDKQEGKLNSEDIMRLTIYFCGQIQLLAKKITLNDQSSKGLRQRVISSAIVYFRRFYYKHEFAEFCPRLVAPTCLYISSKVEECSTQAPAFRFEKEMKKIDPTFPYSTSNILECEFYVIEALNFDLIIFHPYRPLVEYINDQKLQSELLESAWGVLNDSYFTNNCLMFPPHIIALSAIYLAAYVQEIDVRQWFAELNVEMKDVWEAVDELINFYDLQQDTKYVPIAQVLSKLPTSMLFVAVFLDCFPFLF